MRDAFSILVIDDDEDLAFTLKMILGRKGYVAETALNADDAKEAIRVKEFDLLMIDKLLSGTDGTDLCIALRKTRKIAHTPIIMFSAHSHAGPECIEAGADEFIAKPFDLFELFIKIDHLLHKEPTAAALH